MVLHCAAPTTSPPACHQCHGSHGALRHQAAAAARALRLLPRLASVSAVRADRTVCRVRRRVRYDEEDEDEDEDEVWGHNEDVAKLERYSEDARDQALLVKARVDDEVEVVLIFKGGFSSSLSGRTAADPAKSILPERAIIQSIDVVKGPFDPNNIEYLEKDLAWDNFQSRLQ